MSRIPLSTDLKTRTGAPDKDARLRNCYVEVRGDQSAIRRRASCQSDGDVIVAGTAQGGIGVTINGTDLVVTVNGDYIVMGSGSIGGGGGGGGGSIGGGGGGGGGYIGTQPVSLADPNVSDINWMLLIPYCDEADILASYPTDDKGTSVFAGPAETAYTVPQTTATRTIHGETPCGQLLIKTVTKTYSLRMVGGLYIGTANFVAQGKFSSEFAGGVFAIGTTKDAWADYAATQAADGTSIGATYIGIGAGSGEDIVSSETPDSSFYSNQYSSVVISYFAHGNSFSSMASTHTSNIIIGDVYYLDVHEVWTYSVI